MVSVKKCVVYGCAELLLISVEFIITVSLIRIAMYLYIRKNKTVFLGSLSSINKFMK